MIKTCMRLPGMAAIVLMLSNSIQLAAAAEWNSETPMVRARSESSVVTYQDKFYVFNGFAPAIDIEPTIERFDPVTGQWSVIANTSVSDGTAVTHNGIVLTGSKVWIIGGRIGDHPGAVSSKVWIYDIANGLWTAGPELPVAGAAGGAALINNRIHWFGGLDTLARCDVSNHFVLDLNAQTAGWQNITATAPMPIPRNHFSTAVLNGKILAIGGQFGHGGCAGTSTEDSALVHQYDPATNTWSQLASLPAVQSHAEPSTFVHNGLVYVVGGQTAGNKVFVYNPQTNSWSHLMDLPQNLLAPVSRIFNGRLYVAGGGAPTTSAPVNEVWSIEILPPANSGSSSALMVREAEDYDTRTGTPSHQWVNSALTGSSNNDAMVTTPNSGTLKNSASGSAMMSYLIDFEQSGTHYLWIRGWGDELNGEGKNDSIHAGLNGSLSSTADKIDGFPAGWNWSNHTRDGAVARLNVPSAGVHVVNLWMREDGLAVDKFLITTDANYVPQGYGPDVDAGGNPPPNAAPIVSAGSDTTVTLGNALTLSGSVVDDGLSGTAVTTNWSKTAGPGTVTFTQSSQLQTSVIIQVAGTYTFKLTASDGLLVSQDSLTVTVNDSSGTTTTSSSTVIIREAEDYNTRTGTSTHQWINTNLSDSSNNDAMVTTPNSGALKNSASGSAMMSYLIDFAHSGTHYLWLRGWGDELNGEGKNDSIHAGLNGSLSSTADKIDGFPANWNWSNHTRDGAVARLNIPSVGVHSVNLWMREDGLAIDKFLITTDANYVPIGMNPSTGSTGTGTGTSATNTAPVFTPIPDQSIDFGDTLTATGSVTDDGLPNGTVTLTWSKRLGPGTISFTNPGSVQSSMSFSQPGDYIVRLTAHDGELRAIDQFRVKVNEVSTGTGTGTGTTNGQAIDAFTAWNLLQTSDGSYVEARHEAGAVELGGKIYVMGGRNNKPVESFDPSTGKWTNHGIPPVYFHHFQPVAVNERIYVIGALKDSGYPEEQNLPHVYSYDPSTNSWTQGRSIPSNRRRGATGAAVYNGKIYLIGGNTLGHKGPSVKWFDEYDPVTENWTILPDAPKARDHAMVAIANGKLVVAAGRRSAYPNVFGDLESATDVYDFATGTWLTNYPDIPTGRAGTMTVSHGDEVVVIGGESLAISAGHDSVESLNLTTGQWRTLQPLLVGRHSGGAAVADGKIHVIAGNTTRGGGNETSSHETLDLP